MIMSSGRGRCIVESDAADRLAKGGFLGINPAAQPLHDLGRGLTQSLPVATTASPSVGRPASRSSARRLRAVRPGGAKWQSSSFVNKMPDEDGELAHRRDDGAARAAAVTHKLVERRERARRPGGSMGRLGEQTMGVSLAGSADVAAHRRPIPRLPDARVETEIAHELGWSVEAADVADNGQETGRGHQADTRDRLEATDSWVIDHELGDHELGKPRPRCAAERRAEGPNPG